MTIASAGSRSPAVSGHSTSTTPSASCLGEAELVELGRRADAVEIEMRDRQPCLIGLHEREGRARHVERGVAGQRPHQRARQRGLAGAEIALQRDDVAGTKRGGDVLAEQRGRFLIRQDAFDRRHEHALLCRCCAGAGRHRRETGR